MKSIHDVEVLSFYSNSQRILMECGAMLIPQKDPLLLDAGYCDGRRLLFVCLEACNQLVRACYRPLPPARMLFRHVASGFLLVLGFSLLCFPALHFLPVSRCLSVAPFHHVDTCLCVRSLQSHLTIGVFSFSFHFPGRIATYFVFLS